MGTAALSLKFIFKKKKEKENVGHLNRKKDNIYGRSQSQVSYRHPLPVCRRAGVLGQ